MCSLIRALLAPLFVILLAFSALAQNANAGGLQGTSTGSPSSTTTNLNENQVSLEPSPCPSPSANVVEGGPNTMALFVLILKFIASIVAAIIATKLVVIKSESDATAAAHAGKWRLTTEGLLGISALWIALVFSTGVDILNYVEEGRTSVENRKKEYENKCRSDQLLALEQGISGLAARANARIDQANDQLKTSADTLTGVVQRQVKAADTANETLGRVNTANERLRESADTASQTLSRLIETSGIVHRFSKPLRPLKFLIHVKYEYGSTSDEFKQYIDNVKRIVNEIEANVNANREDARLAMDRGNWSYDANNIYINGPSPLTRLEGARRVQQILTSGTVGITVRPTEYATATVARNQVIMIGHANFGRNQPQLGPGFSIIPRPSNLQIVIDRNTGDITQLFFIERIDPIGAVFGINSLYDLPSKWLELSLPVPVNTTDNPKVAYFAYQNDTFITNGVFPESIILDSSRFRGPANLTPSRSNPNATGVEFVYPLREDDLDSAARFENQRP